MPQEPLSISDFAAKIKAKYPDYASIDDETLAQKIITKYPEYESNLSSDDVTHLTEKRVQDAAAAFDDINGRYLAAGRSLSSRLQGGAQSTFGSVPARQQPSPTSTQSSSLKGGAATIFDRVPTVPSRQPQGGVQQLRNKFASTSADQQAIETNLRNSSPVTRTVLETLLQGAAGITEAAAGSLDLLRSIAPSGPLPAQMQAAVQQMQGAAANMRGGEETSKAEHPEISKLVRAGQSIAGGAIEFAPLALAPELEIPAALAGAASFGGYSALQASGRGESAGQVARTGATQAVLGAAMGMPSKLLPFESSLARSGAKLSVVSPAAYTMTLANGGSQEDALHAAVLFPLMAVPGEVASFVKAQRAPKYIHDDFGTVTEAADQSSVPTNKVRVTDETGDTHVIIKPSTVRNQRAIPLREGWEVLNPDEVAQGAKPKVGYRPKGVQANAEEVRSNQGQAGIQGGVSETGQDLSGQDLQQPAETGAGSGNAQEQVGTVPQRVTSTTATSVPSEQPPTAAQPATAETTAPAPPQAVEIPAAVATHVQKIQQATETGNTESLNKLLDEAGITNADLAVAAAKGQSHAATIPLREEAAQVLPSRQGQDVANAVTIPARDSTVAGTSATEQPVTATASTTVPDRTGIAQRVEEARRQALGAESPTTGAARTPEELVNRGRQLLANGVDPAAAITKFSETGAVSADDMALVRAQHEQLTRVANQAADAHGTDSKQFKDAEAARTAFWDSAQPMRTAWGETGRAQQGETAIDSGTFYGLYRAFKDVNGREMTAGEAAQAKDLVQRVSKTDTGSEGTSRALAAELDKAHGLSDLYPDVRAAVQRFVDQSARESRAAGRRQVKKSLDDEAAVLKSNIAAEFARLRSQQGGVLSAGGLGNLDPEGVITKNIINLAKNRVKAGVTDIAQLVDEVHAAVKDFADISRRQVAEVIAGLSGPTVPLRPQSDWMAAKGGVREQLKAEDAAQAFADLKARIAGGTITPTDAKAIWQHARENYVDKGVNVAEAFQSTARDLGITPQQVREAVVNQPKTQRMTDEMYRQMSARREARGAAESWIRSRDMSPVFKVLKGYNDTMFNVAVAGHGTVAPGTHAAGNIFHPTRWAIYMKNVARTWDFAFSPADHEQAMQDLVNDPNHTMWRRAALAVDPAKNYDEYQNPQIAKIFGTLGKMGNRGFDALKTMRQDFANARWNKLSEDQRTLETAQEIARIVNHSTGAAPELRLPDPYNKVVRAIAFAAPLEASRWARIVGDPVRTVSIYSRMAAGQTVTASERYFAKETVKNVAGFAATYTAALALNQGVLSASGSKDKVNFTDPSKPDWLRFKVAGRPLEFTGGIIATIDFLGKLASAQWKPDRGETPYQTMWKAGGQYVRGKFSPGFGTAVDVATRTDYSGRPMPFSSNEGTAAKPRLGYAEYIAQRGPIPASEGIRDFYDEMRKQGVPMSTVNELIQAVRTHVSTAATSTGIGAFSGATGLRVGKEWQDRSSTVPPRPTTAPQTAVPPRP